MSPAQKKKYWCLWGQVRKALTQLGEYSAADADAERSAITVEALGHAAPSPNSKPTRTMKARISSSPPKNPPQDKSKPS